MLATSNLTKENLICYSGGGIDLQINGALGIAFNELNVETAKYLPKICQFLWQQGLDGLLPTLVTTSLANYNSALAVIHDAMSTMKAKGLDSSNGYAEILGVHLEGPFLHPHKRGAHPTEHLQPLNLETIKQVIGDHVDIVKLITLAPELDPTNEVIPYLTERGIVVSLGHSTASAEQAKQAFQYGAQAITHAYNAMPSLHHREPGMLATALLDDRVWCAFIADGVHVHPQMLDLLIRLKTKSHQFNRAIIVSDALAPLGLGDGHYPWDDRQIEVKEGTAKLADGTLSGTTRSLLDGVQNLVQWQICPPEQAIAMATTAPRQLLNLPEKEFPTLVWYWQADGQLSWQRYQP